MTAARVQPTVPRGAAPVGQLRELPVLELEAILLLGQWCDGDHGRIRIVEDPAQVMDAASTAKAVNDLGHLLTLLTPAMAWEAVQSAAPVGRSILCLARWMPVQPHPTKH